MMSQEASEVKEERAFLLSREGSDGSWLTLGQKLAC
jgi:hypothetical protein